MKKLATYLRIGNIEIAVGKEETQGEITRKADEIGIVRNEDGTIDVFIVYSYVGRESETVHLTYSGEYLVFWRGM